MVPAAPDSFVQLSPIRESLRSMPLLRLLLAGLVALAALAAVFFTAVLVMASGLVGYVLQLFRRGPSQAPAPDRRTHRPTDDVIDVESTDVPDKPAGP